MKDRMTLQENLRSIRMLHLMINSEMTKLHTYLDYAVGMDKVEANNIKIWIDHYINGECSFESLKNIAQMLGFPDLFNDRKYAFEVTSEGKIIQNKFEEEE